MLIKKGLDDLIFEFCFKKLSRKHKEKTTLSFQCKFRILIPYTAVKTVFISNKLNLRSLSKRIVKVRMHEEF